MRKEKAWCLGVLAILAVLLIVPALLTAGIDPFFHYHPPLEALEYPIDNQRYQNDGIVRNFSYDALITGTSMTENFKTSEMDDLFGVTSVKVSFSGGSFSEISRTVQQALECNPRLRLVLFGLDEWFLFAGRELIQASGGYPTYLYDDDPFNDVNYLLNKDIFLSDTLGVLDYTRSGQTTTSFDAYGSWADSYTYEAANVLNNYTRPPKAEAETGLTPELERQLLDTVCATAIEMAQAYPNVQFIYFFPPYSILNWDSNCRQGVLQRQLQGFALTSRTLLQQENIQLYAFFDDYATVTDLNNYRDTVHYSGQINSLILQRIHNGQYRLTLETCDTYWQKVGEFYREFDYDALFRQTQ